MPVPKTVHIVGQTWLLTIIHLIQKADLIEQDIEIPKAGFDEKPFFEHAYPPPTNKLGSEIANQMTDTEPRVIKSHLDFSIWKEAVGKVPDMKIIQIIRNPKDILVSFYHMYKMDRLFGCYNGSWEDFFALAEKGLLFWGDPFKHITAWYKFNKSRKNSLVLFYEELKEDLKGNVVKIASFLGKNLSENVIDYIVEKTTFENMAKDPKYNLADLPQFDTTKSTFMRKGKVGDWKEYFSDEQNAFVDAKCKEWFEPEGLKMKYE